MKKMKDILQMRTDLKTAQQTQITQEELKSREIELELLLDNCDEMLRTDCHLNGLPLTDEDYIKLWRDIRKFEDELNAIKKKKSHTQEKKEQKKATVNYFSDDCGGMDGDSFIYKRKDYGLEI